MTIETLTSLKFSFFIFGFLIFFILETVCPNRSWSTARYKRLGFHLVLAIFNTIIMRLPILFFLTPILLIVTESGFGILFALHDVPLIKFILSLIILDIALYWWHRLNHTNQFLWRFHYVHHVDTHMDVGTSLRFHIGELILSTIYKGIIIFLFGITISEFLFYEILLVFSIQFHHSNLKLSNHIDDRLSKIIVTPKYHTNHHTMAIESREANYASLLTIWDRLFFSYKDASDDDREVMGVQNRDMELKFLDNIYHPFNKNIDSR